MRAWLTALLATSCVACAMGADDPYAPWMQGRPHDALPALQQAARARGGWGAWYDCGLAAQAAGEPGTANACLLEAHRLAPSRPEPLAAVRASGAVIPTTWLERLGPIGIPGSGWSGTALLALAGACLGWWSCVRVRRGGVATVGALLLLAGGPGAVAALIDAHAPLVAVVHDSHLVDSTGATTIAIAAGTVLVRERQPPWNGRVLVRMPDGQRGYLSVSETRVGP